MENLFFVDEDAAKKSKVTERFSKSLIQMFQSSRAKALTEPEEKSKDAVSSDENGGDRTGDGDEGATEHNPEETTNQLLANNYLLTLNRNEILDTGKCFLVVKIVGGKSAFELIFHNFPRDHANTLSSKLYDTFQSVLNDLQRHQDSEEHSNPIEFSSFHQGDISCDESPTIDSSSFSTISFRINSRGYIFWPLTEIEDILLVEPTIATGSVDFASVLDDFLDLSASYIRQFLFESSRYIPRFLLYKRTQCMMYQAGGRVDKPLDFELRFPVEANHSRHHIIPASDMALLWHAGIKEKPALALLLKQLIYDEEDSTINACEWMPCNLFAGPEANLRSDDPGKHREVTKPISLPATLWTNLQAVFDILARNWIVRHELLCCNNAQHFSHYRESQVAIIESGKAVNLLAIKVTNQELQFEYDRNLRRLFIPINNLIKFVKKNSNIIHAYVATDWQEVDGKFCVRKL